MLIDETQITEFAVFCVLNIDSQNPSVTEYVDNNEVQTIDNTYSRIFGYDPSSATIVRIVGRILLKEINPGMFIHVMRTTGLARSHSAASIQNLSREKRFRNGIVRQIWKFHSTWRRQFRVVKS